MSVCCECCVLSGRGLCEGLITRPEGSYRVWCVSECDREASKMRRSWPTGGCCATAVFGATFPRRSALQGMSAVAQLALVALPCKACIVTNDHK
jgi:hypothetical protein